MLTEIHPKLPMRDKEITKDFYLNQLGFQLLGDADYDGYLMVYKDSIQIHFFEFKDLDPAENYGQVYIRTENIDLIYKGFLENQVKIHPNAPLAIKPWDQKEFSILDPDSNLLTFGEHV
ncbi:bleomycin resistance protein [Sphingobacterium hungaricum]|uniref:Bleomycin resistance protein n=1 Tax=Sphingobacterium hungaricum TaxID=2082723 RepID=A0A928YPU0_9SPHI|nr:VOC family protein [Sphingobacterium hungaricum]MBE8713249.1 glyoxalase/bleomycin resistance/extradiol dioxygenase family protein [Sphingobacterium hungaricum]